MNVLKNLFIQHIINTHIWVSVTFCSLYCFSIASLNIPIDATSLFMFFSTLFIYNLSEKKEGRLHLKSYKKLTFFLILLGGIGCLFTIKEFSKSSLILLIVCGFISALYSVPFFLKPLRNYPTVKLFLIAGIWATVCTFIPLLEFNLEFNTNVYIRFMGYFCFVLAITIPFDIRDLLHDERHLKTIPILLGETYSKALSIFLFLISLIALSFSTNLNLSSKPLFFTALIGICLLIRVSHQKNMFYFTFWIEVIALFPYLILFIFLK